ncbi:MAG: hypothetical protein Q8O35_13865 [Humidesulfovibrio sp.]|uniref:hypothetical protein n=1 Tax=Humidesulfovibrio sp. TaxID=2910988 RepID=UPI002732F22D|nr:hypothetical protein [Humidesulfovibrio sp.]MDP2849255.1 hypothetical protein [Humidesulfovibrio sp.]
MRPLDSAGSPGGTPGEGDADGRGQGWRGRLCGLPVNLRRGFAALRTAKPRRAD